MIYTLTFNPALDYTAKLTNYETGAINRTESETIYAGGKGINVSRILTELGVENTALGFIAGHTGDMIEAILKTKGVCCDFLRLENGFTRINVKIKSDTETDINGQGPKIDEEAMSCLFAKLDKLCDGDTLILAGSVPSALPKTLYADILRHLKDKNIFTVIDAEGELLTNTLAQNPDLIKPNNIELGEIFKKELKSEDEIIECAKELQKMGAKNVLVSLGKDGALLMTENKEVIRALAPSGTSINTTGAGDSMVAGFIAGLKEKRDFEYALKLGICAGSATAFSEDLATGEDILTLMK